MTALSKRLDQRIAEERRVASDEVAAERKARLEADKKLHEGIRKVVKNVNALDDEMLRQQEATVEVDAYGLPVVLIGIVLTGIPGLIAFAGWASAGPAILFAAALTWGSRRRALARRTATES